MPKLCYKNTKQYPQKRLQTLAFFLSSSNYPVLKLLIFLGKKYFDKLLNNNIEILITCSIKKLIVENFKQLQQPKFENFWHTGLKSRMTLFS